MKISKKEDAFYVSFIKEVIRKAENKGLWK
jgi:hypothetical protein